MNAKPLFEFSGIRDLEAFIHDVPDFPKPGIVFKDITPLLGDPAALSMAVEFLTQPFRNIHVDFVIGAESRGFIFAMTVARNLSAGFVPIRKSGKLPRKTRRVRYDLEYGEDSMEIHADAIPAGSRVLLVDDLLATGGTMKACVDLVGAFNAQIVGIAFLIELSFLNGRDKLHPHPIHSVLQYDR
jgi:adenine phosphoribosyltransferase